MFQVSRILTFSGFLLILACGGGGENQIKSIYKSNTSPRSSFADQIDFGNVQISKGLDLFYNAQIGFKLIVSLGGDLQGNCAFDRSKNITYLEILAGIRTSVSPGKYSFFSSDPLENKPHIFSEGNLCQVRYPYDYHQAAIYLSSGPDRIQIGRFKPLSMDGLSSNATMPEICEGIFTNTCSIRFKARVRLDNEQALDNMPGLNQDFGGLVTLHISNTMKNYVVYSYQR